MPLSSVPTLHLHVRLTCHFCAARVYAPSFAIRVVSRVFFFLPTNAVTQDHDDVFDHATRLYSMRVLLLAVLPREAPYLAQLHLWKQAQQQAQQRGGNDGGGGSGGGGGGGEVPPPAFLPARLMATIKVRELKALLI